MEEKKLFLLDAMALIYRAYFALNKNPRITSSGLNTSAILGFANALLDVLRREKPTHLGVAFDTMAPTSRHLVYSDYKANRAKMPEDIGIAIPYIQKLLYALNIPVLYLDGYEADDVIGTLAKKAEKKGYSVYMVTPDKDFGQLVSENIFMYKPARMGNGAEIMGVSEVCNKYGIERPQQVIDILGLWGDAADNIPGIPGVGEVTACKLLARFGSIENLIEQADEIENPKLKEKVKIHANQAIESKKLATIILDVPIDFSEEKLKICSPNVTDTTALLEELEMRSFASRLLAYYTGEKEGKKNISKVNTDLDVIEIQSKKGNKTVEDKQIDLFSDNGEVEMSLVEVAVSARKEKAEKWDTVEKLQKGLLALRNGGGNIAFYLFPSNKENYCSLHILCAAFSDEEGHLFYYIPESVSNLSVLEKQAFSCFFEENDFLKSKQGEASFSFANLLAERSPKPLLITYNLKEQLHLLWGENLTFNASVFCGFDVMLAHYVIDPESGHDLKRMVENYSFASMVDFSAEEYSLWVVENLVSLQLILSKKMKEVEAETLFREVEMPLTFVLADMERVGVRLDTQRLKQYGEELSLKIQEIEQKIYTLAGVMFNIASPKQLGEILYEKLELTDKPKHTKTKKWSTAEDVLQKLVHKHPIVALVLEYRSLAKLKSTYVDALPLLVDPNSGHLHTTYNQAVTSTGRLSSQNPNLQNIPIRTQMGKEIRKSFVADKAGNVLLAADYSQIELRIIAQLSQDKTMLEDFIEHKDIHTATAAKVFNVSMAEVDQTMRRAAKMVNFGILYGISAFGLAERLNVSRKESAELIEKYFEKYSGLKHYMDAAISIAKEKGYVETLLHRRRYVKDINSGNALVRSYAERNAINAPIQGSSADMIKMAMIRIFNTFAREGLKSKMILQVHDELIFDVLEEERKRVSEIVEREMKGALPMTVPIEVEINFADNWLDAH